MTRASTILMIALLATGCSTGLEGNIPLDEAEHMAPAELVTAVHAPAGVEPAEVVMDARLWVPWGAPLDAGVTELRSVGSTHGVTLLARGWDRAPYDALFTQVDAGHWQEYAPVIGRAGTADAAAEH